ncbi:unnamed protein product [Dovyalis caffra]|uniref:Uncharacterized protein n=1 Tax=Dovyalis caffra TaxID=77055 RepID=A0AAV1RCV7_9ROSI|nr:unnamed protein product [Dovyalis caffra]
MIENKDRRKLKEKRSIRKEKGRSRYEGKKRKEEGKKQKAASSISKAGSAKFFLSISRGYFAVHCLKRHLAMEMKKIACAIIFAAASVSAVMADEVAAPAPSPTSGASASLPVVGSLVAFHNVASSTIHTNDNLVPPGLILLAVLIMASIKLSLVASLVLLAALVCPKITVLAYDDALAPMPAMATGSAKSKVLNQGIPLINTDKNCSQSFPSKPKLKGKITQIGTLFGTDKWKTRINPLVSGRILLSRVK